MTARSAVISINTLICYDRNFRSVHRNAILAGRFITKVQLPRALLTRFLNMLSDGKLTNQIHAMNEENSTNHVPKPQSTVPYGTDELFMNTYIYTWIINNNARVILDRNYSTPWLLFKMLDKEGRNLMQKYTYFPTQAKFLKIKQILENAEPDEQTRQMECYKDLRKTLPKLKTGFVVQFVVDGMNLEKI
jgi:hypothetical protein